MRAVYYLIVVFILVGSLWVYQYYREHYEISLLTEEAVKPDLLLDNSKYYMRDHAYDRSIQQLDYAIKSIRNIEEDLDGDSKRLLEISITDLEKVRYEMEHDSVVTKDLNVAFSKALNALTLAELKVSEALLLEKDDPHDAIVALKYGMYHIKNALRYSAGEKKEYEVHIYEEMDSLLENKSLTKKEFVDRLELMISELDSLVEGEIADHM